MKTPIRLLPLLLLLAAAGAASAQTPELDIRANLDRAGANYYAYEFTRPALTPAPEGYKPFYISHYGRHGCRFLSHDSFKYPVGKLRLMEEKGLLNERGKKLLQQVEELYSMTEGHWGDLTPRGEQEHAAIAREMADRFPGVFDGEPRIRARSSYADRCLRSMDAFTTALSEWNPRAKIDKDGGKQYRYYLNDLGKEVAFPANDMVDSLKKAWLDIHAFLSPLVTDCDAAAKLLGRPDRFEWELGEICLITQCMPTSLDMVGFIPFDELMKLWRLKNILLWYRHGLSPDYGSRRVPAARNLALDFVHKADSVILAGDATAHYAADVRFGHDSALLAFMCYLGAAGFNKTLSVEETDIWHSYENIGMASNFQLVFFRDPAGRILVQGIYNSREITFPALGNGPFYPWKQFRDYLLSRENYPFTD